MAIIKVTKDNFEAEVLNNSKPVLLDFWASWCGPCRMIAPVIEEIASEREDIAVGKVDVDHEQELAVQFGITSIPALIVVKDGKVVNKAVGYRQKEGVLKLLEAQ